MAHLGQSFDAREVAPREPMDLLPPGKYAAQIVQSEMRATKAGDGQYLWLELDIIDGPHKGRKIWDRLNLVNSNEQTVEIARRTLSAICHAVGQMHVSDSEQLHFKPMLVTVKFKPAGKDRYGVERDASNEVGGYSPLGGMPAARPAQASTAPAAAPAGPPRQPTAVPPWRRAG